ncbi:MAG: hypothetical protein Q7R48_01935 [bacterium]|nr:hypothetical protein [bacterium]
MRNKGLVDALRWVLTLVVCAGITALMMVSFNLAWYWNAVPLMFFVAAVAMKRPLVSEDEPVSQTEVGEYLGVLAVTLIATAGAWYFWWPQHQGRVAQVAIGMIVFLSFITFEFIATRLQKKVPGSTPRTA